MKPKTRDLFILSIFPFISVFTGLVVCKNIYVTFFLYHFIVCLLLPLIYYLIRNKKPGDLIPDIGINKLNLRNSIAAGIISGAVFMLVIMLGFSIFRGQFIDVKSIKILLAFWGFQEKQLIFFLVYFILFNSVVEELFWRGFLCNEFNKRFGIWASSFIVSFFFIQYHCLTILALFGIAAALIFTPVLFFVSVFWCYTRYYFKNPYTAIISHLFADFALMAVYIKFVVQQGIL